MTETMKLSTAPNEPGDGRYVRFFSQIGIGDVPLVGGKNASLGEMYRALTPRGIRVPNGFAVTAEAYRHTLDRADAWTALHAALVGSVQTDLKSMLAYASMTQAGIIFAEIGLGLRVVALASRSSTDGADLGSE